MAPQVTTQSLPGRMRSLESAITPQDDASVADSEAKSTIYEGKSVFLSSLPEELRFLDTHHCNPDFNSAAARKAGYVQAKARPKEDEQEEVEGRSRRCYQARMIVGAVVLAQPVQVGVMGVILFDLVLLVLSLAEVTEDTHPIYDVGNYLVLVVLSLDVFGRFFYAGLRFLKSLMNDFELLIVPITIAEVFFLQDLNAPVPLLRALRPILRIMRVLRAFAATLGKGSAYLAKLRKQVSGDRIRFTQDGFDLDLAYISTQIIAMSTPATGYERLFRNYFKDVARFLNERHWNRYLLVNTTEHRKYPLKPFFGRYYHFSMEHQGVPSLRELWNLCQILDIFLKDDAGNTVAFHSYHGQGRVSMAVIALLLFRGTYPSVESCIAHYEHSRARQDNRRNCTTTTFDNASQRRFLEYFAQMCHANRAPQSQDEVRSAKLRRIILVGLHTSSTIDVFCFKHVAPSTGTLVKSKSVIEDPDEEEEVKSSTESMINRMRNYIEEGAFDSVRAGCAPMKGRPAVSTVSNPPKMVLQPTDPDDPLQPSVWNVVGTDSALGVEFTGEIRIELHKKGIQVENVPSEGRPASSCCSCGRRRRRGRNNANAVKSNGMVFCCWLHTSFLEYNEPQDKIIKSNLVTVELDRFSLDKAANSPTLRSYSSELRLVLEFEVNDRAEWCAPPEDDGLDFMRAFNIQPTGDMSELYPLSWLTWVSKQVWPKFTIGFESLIRNNVMPSLKESIPAPLKSIRLAQCSFGDSYPHFGEICASSRTHDGLEVQLDITLKYSTATNIVLDAGFVTFGISRLRITGLLSLRFKPILEVLPVFSAMQILFLNQPDVDLHFSRGLEIANSSTVRNVIFGAINKAISDLMVIPNIININWADPADDSSLSFRNVPPVAVLRLYVVEGRNLNAEKSVFKRQPDTSVKLQLGAQAKQTQVVAKNVNPVWGRKFDFMVYDKQQHIHITVVDIDYSGRAHVMGSPCRLPVWSFQRGGDDGQWIQLGKGDTTYGEVLIKGSLLELNTDAREILQYAVRIAEAGEASAAVEEPEPEAESPGDFTDAVEAAESVAYQKSNVGENTPRDPVNGSDSVALLVCEIAGGHCPSELAAASALDVNISMGHKVRMTLRCVELQKADAGNISEKAKKSVERLAAFGMTAEEIAESLGEDQGEVTRIVRRRGWNLELPQKFCLLVTEETFRENGVLEITLMVKKKVVARGNVLVRSILQAPSMRYQQVVMCKPVKKATRIELDAEFRMFALQPV